MSFRYFALRWVAQNKAAVKADWRSAGIALSSAYEAANPGVLMLDSSLGLCLAVALGLPLPKAQPEAVLPWYRLRAAGRAAMPSDEQREDITSGANLLRRYHAALECIAYSVDWQRIRAQFPDITPEEIALRTIEDGADFSA